MVLLLYNRKITMDPLFSFLIPRGLSIDTKACMNQGFLDV